MILAWKINNLLLSYVVVDAHWLQLDYVTLVEADDSCCLGICTCMCLQCSDCLLCSAVIFLYFERLRSRTLSVKDTVEFSSNSSKSLWIWRQTFCNTVKFRHVCCWIFRNHRSQALKTSRESIWKFSCIFCTITLLLIKTIAWHTWHAKSCFCTTAVL